MAASCTTSCASWRPDFSRAAIGLAALAAPVALAGCSTGEKEAAAIEQAAAEDGAAVETLAAADLAALHEAGEVVLIDVRTPAEFAEGHIAGALNAPARTFDAPRIPIDRTRETVLYGAGPGSSREAAGQLARHLGTTVRHLEGGLAAWRKAGFETPTAGGAADED